MDTRRPHQNVSNPARRGPRLAAVRPDPREELRRRQLESLLNKLDAQAATDPARLQRKSVRLPFRHHSIPIRVHHPGGTSNLRKVLSRDLSAGGMSFLLDGYLYPGTRVDVVLPKLAGGEDVIHGLINNCTHLSGMWHSVGLSFDAKIFPKLYIRSEDADSFDFRQDPSTLCGRILHLDDQELDRRLLTHHLRRTRIELVSCSNFDEAKRQFQEGDTAFDVVVTELHLDPAGNGVPAAGPVAALRGISYAGPLVVCTAEADPAKLRTAKEAGATEVLLKPYPGDRLVNLMASLLNKTQVVADKDETPAVIASSLAGGPETAQLVMLFVKQATLLAEALRQAAEDGNAQSVHQHCRMLRGSGSGYGFTVVSEAAEEALRQLAMGGLPGARPALERLSLICSRLSAHAA